MLQPQTKMSFLWPATLMLLYQCGFHTPRQTPSPGAHLASLGHFVSIKPVGNSASKLRCSTSWGNILQMSTPPSPHHKQFESLKMVVVVPLPPQCPTVLQKKYCTVDGGDRELARPSCNVSNHIGMKNNSYVYLSYLRVHMYTCTYTHRNIHIHTHILKRCSLPSS